MSAPRQSDLFNRSAASRPTRVETPSLIPAERSAAPEPFDFARDGTPLVPGSLDDVPEWLRIPLVDSPDWMPAPAVEKKP